MLPEIALHILDIAQNSLRAGASLVAIDVTTAGEALTLTVTDDGCGMSAEERDRVTDPFTTSRSTRRVGLGLPFLKLACELTGGDLFIESEPGRGTTVCALFHTGHIDCMPLGDLPGTFRALITLYPARDFLLTRTVNGRTEALDTRTLRRELFPVPLCHPKVLTYVQEQVEAWEDGFS